MLSVQSQTPILWPHSVLYIEDIGRFVFFSADMYDTIRVTTTERKSVYYVIVDSFASYIQFVSVLWFKNLRSLDLMFIGFNMTEKSLKTREARLTAYHRIIEAFKFAYAQRSELGDPEFVSNVTQVWNMFPCYWKPTELKFLNFIFRVFRLLIYSSDSCIDWISEFKQNMKITVYWSWKIYG